MLLAESQRKSVQLRFMSDKLRIVVATIAFGMGAYILFFSFQICSYSAWFMYYYFLLTGLDKQNVRAVIHFNAPRSLEQYSQEVSFLLSLFCLLLFHSVLSYLCLSSSLSSCLSLSKCVALFAASFLEQVRCSFCCLFP